METYREYFNVQKYLCQRRMDHGKRTEVSQVAKIRSTIRKINENKFWLGNIFTALRNKIDKSSEPYIDLEGDLININEKVMLMTRSETRKDSDVKKLARKLSNMPPFQHYSQSIVRQLVKHSRIIGFEEGRVLFDVGDEPLGAYFILNGEVQFGPDERTDPVQMLLETIDKNELKELVQKMKIRVYGGGTLIGLNEVLFGEARPDRVTVTKNVLCIHFERRYILGTFSTLISRWHEIFKYLTEYEVFQYLRFEETRELSTIGKIKRFRAGSLIDVSDTSYFLIEGQIVVIQRLLVEDYYDNGKLKKRLYHDQNALEYENNVDVIFMQVCILRKGSYFGIGERISKNNLWTTDSCRVLYFSKQILLQYGSSELWNDIRARLDAIYPSDSELFQLFQYGRNWMNYKKELSNKLKRRTGLNTIHNVPVTLRMKQIELKRSFMRKVKMTEMPDYLLGGPDPLEDEINNKFVLDPGGPLREYMFGRLKTKVCEKPSEEQFDTRTLKLPMEYDTFPSFYYYDVYK